MCIRDRHILYRRTSGAIEKIYVDFSDDGKQVYSGRETTQINMRGQSSYEADIRLTGPRPGIMKLQMTFGPLGGPKPAAIDFTPPSRWPAAQPGLCRIWRPAPERGPAGAMSLRRFVLI